MRNKVLSFVFHEKTLAVLALLVSAGAVWYAREQSHTSQEQTRAAQEQTRIAQNTLDIATGKRQAKIETADYYPTRQDFPESEILPWGQHGVKRSVYRNANGLVVRSPAIYFNNVGEEAIEAIRIEVSFIGGMLEKDFTKDELKNPPTEWYKADTPVILRTVHREENVLSRPWKPGEGLRVALLRGVLDQISQVQSKTYADKIHLAELGVAVSARLAGSNVFAATTPDPLMLRVYWLPKGFPDEEVKRVMDNYVQFIILSKRERRESQRSGSTTQIAERSTTSHPSAIPTSERC